LDSRNEALKDEFEKKYGKKKAPRADKRVKQSVKRQIQESFEDEAAVEEMSKEEGFWDYDPEAVTED